MNYNRIWGFLCLSLIYLQVVGCSSDKQFNQTVLADKWVSTSNPKCEIWFQNWGDYQRLLMVIESDTIEIKPSPYVTEKKDKPYLTPKPYNKVSKQQLKGNIYWNDAPKWESGTVYNARWEIDRANPKINLPQLYDIEFSLNDNTLKMKLIEDSELYLSFDLKSIKSY